MSRVRLAKIKYPIQILIMLVLVSYLIFAVDPEALLMTLTDLNVAWLFVPFLIALGEIWLNAYRWQIILNGIPKYEIPLWRLAYSQIVGQFFEIFLPSAVGCDVYKMYDVDKFCKSPGRSILSVMFVRVMGFLALGMLLAVGMILSHGIIKLQSIYLAVLAYVIVSICAIGLLIEKRLLSLLLRKATGNKWTRYKFFSWVTTFNEALNNVTTRRGTVLLSLVLGLVFQILIVFMVFFYGLAIDIILPLSDLFLITPLIGLISSVPLTFQSLGVKEGAFVFFLGWVGLTNEQGMIIALLSRLIGGVIIPLMGCLLFVFFRKVIERHLQR